MKYLIVIAQLKLVWLLLSPSLVLSRVAMPATVMGTVEEPQLNCPKKCGDVSIPYRFGIGEGCSWRKSFAIDCNRSYSPPRPYYHSYEVIDITLETGELRVVTSEVAHICYNSPNVSFSWRLGKLDFSPFFMSSEKNEFTGIGCHTVALLGGSDWDRDGSYLIGCVTACKSLEDAANDGDNCAGRGCCRMSSMPSGLDIVRFGWSLSTINSTNPAWKYSSCSYSFVAEKGWYVPTLYVLKYKSNY